jgi:phage-related protein
MTKKDSKDYASTSHKGLPNKKENMNITRQRLKELVKEVMTEESEYQAFFQKALDKAGKDINAMSDDEKKEFFNKIDSAWNGKGEKTEVVEDIATELPSATIPSNVKAKLVMALDRIKDAKLNNNQKLQLVAQFIDSLGVDKSQLGTIANKIRSKMESTK